MNKNFIFCPYCKSELQLNTQGYQECSNADCDYIYYNNPTPVVAAIVEYEHNQVVLAHNKNWPSGWYGLITGFLEKHEHPEDCVIREVKEELGLEGKLISFIGHYNFNRMNQIIIAYHLKANGNIILGDELDDYKVIPFDKVKTWPQGTGQALKEFLKQRGYRPEEFNPFKGPK